MYLSDWIAVCKWVLDIPALLVVAVFVQVDFFFSMRGVACDPHLSISTNHLIRSVMEIWIHLLN